MNTITTKPAFDYKAHNAFKKTPKFWGFFDAYDNQHKYILSLLRQLEWTQPPNKHGHRYADMERFGKWLQSEKSPVRIPLKKMSTTETSTIISALESMVKKHYQK